ncbi:hypothetical protein ACI8B_30313 [Acinetobacter proteolyticus]|uniref:Uncharacterized protein n=1 Tax=Acinetobacter proteolyticus TaxID=1776741 RepID=A0A653K8P0_9GAMM|nr:hypothetical protein ACI8B_30313 [Acinetobacter proteolyticus]
MPKWRSVGYKELIYVDGYLWLRDYPHQLSYCQTTQSKNASGSADCVWHVYRDCILGHFRYSLPTIYG